MRVYFVTNRESINEDMLAVDTGSLVIISHSVGVDIDLVRELDGGSDYLKRLSEYSKRRHLVVVIGIEAKIYRRQYLSVAVIDNGKIMGISDATHDVAMGGKYNLGASYRVYRTALGSMGIVVGSDLLYPEVFRAISTHESDFIIGLAGGIVEKRQKVLLSALSYFNGIMAFCIVDNRAMVTSREGDIIFEDASGRSKGDFVISRDTKLINHLRSDIYDNIYIEE